MRYCRECQAEVSSTAKACPKCGADRPAYGKVMYGLEVFSKGMFALGCLLVVIGAILTIGLFVLALL